MYTKSRILIALLLTATVFLTACEDNGDQLLSSAKQMKEPLDGTKKKIPDFSNAKASTQSQFLTVGSMSFNLKHANLYFMREVLTDIGSSELNRLGRTYIITDGTYLNRPESFGYSYDDYSEATYLIAIELIGPSEASPLDVGSYPMFWNFDSPGYHSFIWMPIGSVRWSPTYQEIQTGEAENGKYSIVIGGGMEDKDKMTIDFNGGLSFTYFDGTNWVGYDDLPSVIEFKGTVIQIY